MGQPAVGNAALIKRFVAGAGDHALAVSARELTDFRKHMPAATLALSARMMAGAALRAGHRAPVASCTITNVPGPQFPMYLLEARMLSNYPMVPLWSQHGLSLALFSYDGKLLWGILADYDAVPDTAKVTRAIEEAFNELELAVSPEDQGAPLS